MSTLIGYKITEKIHVGVRTLIERGVRELDQTSVIIKTLLSEYPTIEEIIRLKHEYKISSHLKLEGIVKPYSLSPYKNSFALILEDFGGKSLKQLLAASQIKLIDFFSLAIKLAQTLGELHQNQIIHKDIKSDNIIVNRETGQVKITDFSISTRLAREAHQTGNSSWLEGTLAYMSPEQTGRMNRSLDYRTDLYSLGITFYEMLTGQLPFNTTDPLELIHCHIAVIPVPPHQLNIGIPEKVSSIVMKLLAKNAEDRYQSAFGLKADLETCLTQFQKTGKIENFIPGQLDKFGQFLIPQKLYGRSQEVTTLMEAFERVSNGATEMVLVSGYSGIGKTSIVNEVHKPIVRQRGYFIAGKFDQFKRNIPYAALIQAFQSLIRQLLTESSEKIAIRKQQLLDALGQQGKVIIDVIPEVELIIGSQPAVPQLGATESQNRINRLFKEFFGVLTQLEHPLVLFLDDLQWADSASLKLIQMLVTDPDSKYVLMIGAYRDNEVSPTHPTIQTIEKIQQTRATINQIILQPLDITHVSQLVSDTLFGGNPAGVQADTERLKLLVELVFNKTAGNPFFLTQFLQTLYSEKLLKFDFIEGCWFWEIAQIQAFGVSDYTVVELVARNIQKLSDKTQHILKLAACIGNQFNLDVLAIVNEESLVTTADDLWEALQAGLILPLSNAYKIPLVFDSKEMGREAGERRSTSLLCPSVFLPSSFSTPISYKFLHDRIQQAAYSLIPEAQKRYTHLKIGRLLLQKIDKYTLKENIFDIVNQLNIGAALIINQSEKDELAKLNLLAGKKAKVATAYEAALRYLYVGLNLLSENAWQSHYDLTLTLHIETVEAEYLNTNFKQAEQLSDVVLSQAKTLLEKVKIYETKIEFYIAQSQMTLAIDTALPVLKMLGVYLPKNPSRLSVLVALLCTKLAQGSKRIEDLASLPEMTDPDKIAAMRILNAILTAAFTAKPTLFALALSKMVSLSLKYGNTPMSNFGYVGYGVTHCSILADIDAGYRYGQLALTLLEQFDTREIKYKILMAFNAFIRPWKEHIRASIESLIEAIQGGLETGNIEGACHSTAFYCGYIFLSGEHLDSVNIKQSNYIEMLVKYQQEYDTIQVNLWNQVVWNLMGISNERCHLYGERFNEKDMLPMLIKTQNNMAMFQTYLAKSFLCYCFKDYIQSVENASLAEKYAEAALGLVYNTVHNLYYSLALLALYPKVSKNLQKQYLKKVALHQKKMQLWAHHSPTNYLHKYELVEAEKARVLRQNDKAAEYYERAIHGAKEQGYFQEEALANELAAEFYFARGIEKIAQVYLTDAYYGYIRWGAKAKVQDLESRYSEFFSQLLAREAPRIEVTQTLTTTSMTGGSSAELDLATVIKASQAISGEIILEKLLHLLMKMVMQNAGAQTVYLLLEKNGKMLIEAASTVNGNDVVLGLSTAGEDSQYMPISLINYVARTKESVVLNDASCEGTFIIDAYITKKQPKSILCIPILAQGKLIGILYLENNLSRGAFTAERIKVLKILSSQAAISIEKARLYADLVKVTENLKQANQQLEDYSRNLENKVQNRTLELEFKNARLKEQATQLEQILKELQATQTQLIQTEKMSSLGQMVAGVAHEINNPINFIYGNLCHATEYNHSLLNLIALYQREYPNPTPTILAEIEDIDLEFLREDLPKLLSSMKVGADRIRQIVLSLRNFSRLDEAEMKPVALHEGIDSTLLILQNRLKPRPDYPGIEVIKEYGNLPLVECYASQLNQVFMNIIANAIDALEIGHGAWSAGQRTESDSSPMTHDQSSIPTIRIRTEAINDDYVAIRIADNGPGMMEEVRSRLFDPFFTTKPVGKGTGLGLSISYQIVVEKHSGQLKCISAPGKGSEFVIEIPMRQLRKNQALLPTKGGVAG